MAAIKMQFDFCLIGGGIVGCATALELQAKFPNAKIVLLEKESAVGLHQTVHNSGVIHAGIYYEPGSLKATLCREGLVATKEFCEQHQIPYQQCGKLIVATSEAELSRLEALYQRAVKNGLSLEKLNAKQLHEREPNISGKAALFSPETSIVDYRLITQKMAELFIQQGGELRFQQDITRIHESSSHVEIITNESSIITGQLIVCAGLQADRMARLAGLELDFKIVPFRGEYYQLPLHQHNIINHLIYPVSDPALPFLGIHLTKMIDGSVTVGPNAVLGFAREGYAKGAVNWQDIWDYANFAGFWKLLWRYRGHIISELQTSFWKSAYLKACQQYCSSLTLADLLPYRAGIRAQIVTSQGELVHDFLLKQTNKMLHVCNAPSPAATSAIAIAKYIVKKLPH